jgi:hypothetical protein
MPPGLGALASELPPVEDGPALAGDASTTVGPSAAGPLGKDGVGGPATAAAEPPQPPERARRRAVIRPPRSSRRTRVTHDD